MTFLGTLSSWEIEGSTRKTTYWSCTSSHAVFGTFRHVLRPAQPLWLWIWCRNTEWKRKFTWRAWPQNHCTWTMLISIGLCVPPSPHREHSCLQEAAHQVSEDGPSAFLGKNWKGRCRLWHLCLLFSCISHLPGTYSPQMPDVKFFLILCNSDKVKQGSWASCWLHVNCFIFKVYHALKISLFKLSPLTMRTDVPFLQRRIYLVGFASKRYSFGGLTSRSSGFQLSSETQIFLSLNWLWKYKVLNKGSMEWQIL